MLGIAGPTPSGIVFPGWFSPVTAEEMTNDGEVKEGTEQKRQMKRSNKSNGKSSRVVWKPVTPPLSVSN